jgi:hypothetical protein
MHCAVRKENSNVIISWLFKQNIEYKKKCSGTEELELLSTSTVI